MSVEADISWLERVLAGAVAAAVLAGGIWAALALWGRRGRAMKALAEKLGAAYFPEGSSDTAIEILRKPDGTAETVSGRELPPLGWADLEGLDLFSRETHASRQLFHLMKLDRAGRELVVFDYQFVETDEEGGSDSAAVQRDLTVLFVRGRDLSASAGAIPETWKFETSGDRRVIYRPFRWLKPEEIESLARSL